MVGTGGMHRMTRKKRRIREAREACKKSEEETKENAVQSPDSSHEGLGRKLGPNSAETTERENERNEDSERKPRRKKSKIKETRSSCEDTSLFEDEKITKSEKVEPSSYKFRGFDQSLKKRKGKKTSVKAFKSKKRYKRRK